VKDFAAPLSAVVFIVIAYFMIVGMSNAVNLTDGLDGLAIMPAALVAAALGVFAYASATSSLQSTSRCLRFRTRASSSSSARHSPARGSGFCGSTRIPRRFSWATSVRSPSVRHWASLL